MMRNFTPLIFPVCVISGLLFAVLGGNAFAQQYIPAPSAQNAVTQTIYIPEKETDETVSPEENEQDAADEPADKTAVKKKVQPAKPAQKAAAQPQKKPVTQPGKFVPFFPVESAAYRNETESQEYLLSSPRVFPGVGVYPRRPRKGGKRPPKGGPKPGHGSHYSAGHGPAMPGPHPVPTPGRDPRLDMPPRGSTPAPQGPFTRPNTPPSGARPPAGPFPGPQGPRPR